MGGGSGKEKNGKTVDAKKKNEEIQKAEELKEEAKQMRVAEAGISATSLHAESDKNENQLKLPEDWKDQQAVNFDTCIKCIENETKIASSGFETKPFVKLEELISVVSGGMVRYGLLYPTENGHHHEIKRGQFPVLQPPKFAESLLPDLTFQTEFYKSTAANASSKFVKNVQSFGLSAIGSFAGNFKFVSGNASASYSRENSKQSSRNSKRLTTEATVVKYKTHPMKAFRVPKKEMKLTAEAECDVKKISNIDDAKRFLDKYGSHIPADVHHLGGIFCDVIEMITEEEILEKSLITEASNQFNNEVSIGGQGLLLDIGLSGTVKILTSEGQVDAKHTKETNASYTRNIKCFGPDSTDLETFCKNIKADNTTWRIIDRGDLKARVAIWDLIKELGDEYMQPADWIEKAWKNYQNIPETRENIDLDVDDKKEETWSKKPPVSDEDAEEIPKKFLKLKEEFLSKMPGWKTLRQQTIDELYKIADECDSLHKVCNIAKVTGSSVRATGGIMALGGILLTPSTFGGSLTLTVAGAATGATTNITSVVESAKMKDKCKAAQDCLDNDWRKTMDINRIIESLMVYMEGIEALEEKLEAINNLETMSIVQNANLKKLVIETAVETAFSNSKNLTTLQIIRSLIEALREVLKEGALTAGKLATCLTAVGLGISIFEIVTTSQDIHAGSETEAGKRFRENAKSLKEQKDTLCEIERRLTSQ